MKLRVPNTWFHFYGRTVQVDSSEMLCRAHRVISKRNISTCSALSVTKFGHCLLRTEDFLTNNLLAEVGITDILLPHSWRPSLSSPYPFPRPFFYGANHRFGEVTEHLRNEYQYPNHKKKALPMRTSQIVWRCFCLFLLCFPKI